MLVPATAEALAGLIVIWLAIRLWQGRVPRGSAVGVRTPSTMRSDAAFKTANKAAAPLSAAGGAAMAIGGVLAAAMPRHLAGGFIFGGVGVFLLFILLGAAIGIRASRAVPLSCDRARRRLQVRVQVEALFDGLDGLSGGHAMRKDVQGRVEFAVWLIEGLHLEAGAPVPAGDFDLVESGDVIDQAAPQFVPAPQFSVAVRIWRRGTASTQVPRGGAVLEVVAGQAAASDLGVHEQPAVTIPVLDHPVVDPPLRHEVAGEAAPDAGCGARGAQQGAVQQREVVAEPDHSPLGRPLNVHGSRVNAEHVVQDRFGADRLHMRHALGRKRQAPNFRVEVVNQQPPHDRTERLRFSRKSGQEIRVASKVGGRARLPVKESHLAHDRQATPGPLAPLLAANRRQRTRAVCLRRVRRRIEGHQPRG